MPTRKQHLLGYYNIVDVCKCQHGDYEHDLINSKRGHCLICLCMHFNKVATMRQSQYFQLRDSRHFRERRKEKQIENQKNEIELVPLNFRIFIYVNELQLKLNKLPWILRQIAVMYFNNEIISEYYGKKRFQI